MFASTTTTKENVKTQYPILKSFVSWTRIMLLLLFLWTSRYIYIVVFRCTHSAALCAIAVHEQSYLDEWLDYHISLGFSHVYLYDNSDDFQLKDYQHSHLTVQHRPGPSQQVHVYHECAKQNQQIFDYLGFLDIDEYLVLKKHSHVIDFFRQYLKLGAVSLNWFVFGTSGQEHYQPYPVTLRFQCREQTVNQLTKAFVKTTDWLDREPHVHFPFTRQGTHRVDTNGQRLKNAFSPNGPTDVAVIHHYATKSIEEYIRKRQRGRASRPRNEEWIQAQIQSIKDGNVPNATTHDDTAWRILKRNVPEYAKYEALAPPSFAKCST